jgi:mannose-6-phosphate isomerase
VDFPQDVAPHVDDPSTVVLDGPYAGAPLRIAMAAASQAILGAVPAAPGGRFPLMFKLIDAHEHLSVQVHPDAAYVADHPDVRLKTESWYLVDAEPDAGLYLGVVPGTTMAEVEAVLGIPNIVPLLEMRAAVRGAFHHVPAGLIHALGAGMLVAEVQTPSDTTFRLYDWSEESGRVPRQLHPEESIASIRIDPPGAFSLGPTTSLGVRELVRCDDYWMREHRLGDGPSSLARTAGPNVLHVVRGSIEVGDLPLDVGATAIVPAACTVSNIKGTDSIVLEMGFDV